MTRIKLPSPAMAISLLALFVALGGTGYAAVKLNGKNIKNRTIAGKKLKNNTLTGKQIKESKLGTVPKAKVATTAKTANALSGSAKAGFLTSSQVGTTGVIKLPAAPDLASAPRRTFAVKGPFSANARCYRDGTNKETLKIGVKSTVPGSALNGAFGTVNDDYTTIAASNPAEFTSTLDYGTLATPAGATLVMATYSGVNAFGAACFVSANTLSHP